MNTLSNHHLSILSQIFHQSPIYPIKKLIIQTIVTIPNFQIFFNIRNYRCELI